MTRPCRHGCLAFIVVAAGLVVSCGKESPSTPSPVVPTTFLSFTSEPGEYVGDGKTLRITPEMATFTAAVGCSDSEIQVTVEGPGNFWRLHLSAPRGARLAGTFSDARYWPIANPTFAAIAFIGNARACGGQAGSFTISDAVFPPDGTVDRFHAIFEQRCIAFYDPAVLPTRPALRGEIQIVRPVPKTPDAFFNCR